MKTTSMSPRRTRAIEKSYVDVIASFSTAAGPGSTNRASCAYVDQVS